MRALLFISVLSLWGTLRGQSDQEILPTYEDRHDCIEIKTKEAFNLNVFPNPCQSECGIQITGVLKGEIATLLVMDLTGKNVFTYTIKDGEVELTLNKTGLDLNEGTYLVQLKKENQIKTKRMVVK